jgi:pimeloyl-ACP methyl ester carboxylesterase
VMKSVIKMVCALAVIALTISGSRAQQVPFLSELFSRYRDFNRLYNQKRSEGANLSAMDELRKRGEDAFKSFNIGALLAVLGEGQTVLEGRAWNDREKYVSSLTLETDRLVLEPARELRVSLTRMFPANSENVFAAPPTVTFVIEPIAGSRGGLGTRSAEPVILADRLPIAETGTSFQRHLLLPEGRYWVIARLVAGSQKLGELRQPLYAISDFADEIRELLSRIATIKGSAEAKLKSVAHLLGTPEFQIHQLAMLNRSRGEENIDVIEALDRLDDTLSMLLRGQNPFASAKGEVERAYIGADGKPVPYRLYIPASYDGTAPRPLVVLLHGVMGDEKMYFTLFDPEVIKGEAERRGYFLMAPYAGGRFGGYTDQAQTDVLEATKAVMQSYKIDGSRVYLTGHSLGAFATWLVAGKRPDLFAAMAPVAGGAPLKQTALQALLQTLKPIPALIVHGSRDGVVPPQSSRDMALAAQKAGMKADYLEVPGADHVSVVAETFPTVLNFFDKIAKPATQK